MDGLVVLGARRLIDEHQLRPDGLAESAAALEESVHTVSWLADTKPGPRLLGLLAFRDTIKETASAAVRRLH